MPQELVGLEVGMRRGVVTGWMERIDFEGIDLVACKIETFTTGCLGLSAGTFLIARQ